MSVRKKNDPIKRYRNSATSALKGCLIINQGESVLIDRDGNDIPVSVSLSKAIKDVPFMWNIYCGVLCRTGLGEDYIQSISVRANARYYQRDLSEVVRAEHRKLIKGCNEAHIRDSVWLASPLGEEIPDKLAAHILSRRGSW